MSVMSILSKVPNQLSTSSTYKFGMTFYIFEIASNYWKIINRLHKKSLSEAFAKSF